MEKEISYTFNSFQINFFYEGFDLKESDLNNFRQIILLITQGCDFFVKKHLSFVVVDQFIMNLNLVDDITIKSLNRDYREKDKITDVLSFPLQENIRYEKYDAFGPAMEMGDLFVCYSVCQKQAKDFKISFRDEFIHLVIHGFLHLCGYDHEISLEEENIMVAFEQKIIAQVSHLKKSL